MTFDDFEIIINETEVTIASVPDYWTPKGLTKVYEVGALGKVSRSTTTHPPRTLKELQSTVNTVINHCGWGVGSLHMNHEDFEVLLSALRGATKEPCQCGATKCGSNIHSHWCPQA